jgi:type III restriction enzyme
VAARYAHFAATRDADLDVPFFQAFAAVTQAGKTVILAEAAARLQAAMPVKPVVLWLTRGRVPAQKAWDGLQPGRRSRASLGGFAVRLLADLDAERLASDEGPQLYFGTVATFGDSAAEAALFAVANSDLDLLSPNQVDGLRARPGPGGARRPLVLVYDEALPMGEQQTDLLMSLEPDLILLASATMKLSVALMAVVNRLRDIGWPDAELTTFPRLAALEHTAKFADNRVPLLAPTPGS